MSEEEAKEKNYERFGEEWKKEMMKWTKRELVDYLVDQCKLVKQLRDEKINSNPVGGLR